MRRPSSPWPSTPRPAATSRAAGGTPSCSPWPSSACCSAAILRRSSTPSGSPSSSSSTGCAAGPRGCGGLSSAARGAALLVAAAVAAPVLLPTLDYLPKTLRADRGCACPTFQGREAAGPGEPLALRWLPVAAPNAYRQQPLRRLLGARQHQRGRERLRGYGDAARRPARPWAPGGASPRSALALIVAALCSRCCCRSLAACWPTARGGRSPPAAAAASLALPRLSGRLHPGALPARGGPPVAAAGRGGRARGPDRLGVPRAPRSPGPRERLDVLRFGWLRWQVRFLVLAALLLLTRRAGGGSGVRRSPARGADRGAELLLAHRPANPPMPRAWPSRRPGRSASSSTARSIRARRGLPDGGARPGRFPPNLPNALRPGGRPDLQPHGAPRPMSNSSRRSSPAGGGRSPSSGSRTTRSTGGSACATS